MTPVMIFLALTIKHPHVLSWQKIHFFPYRGDLNELNPEQVKLTDDNDAVIIITTWYMGSQKRFRSMLPKIRWLMVQTKAGVTKLLRLGTAEIPADVGTKNMRGTVIDVKMSNVMGEY